jgi:hypothetical protein
VAGQAQPAWISIIVFQIASGDRILYLCRVPQPLRRSKALRRRRQQRRNLRPRQPLSAHQPRRPNHDRFGEGTLPFMVKMHVHASNETPTAKALRCTCSRYAEMTIMRIRKRLLSLKGKSE